MTIRLLPAAALIALIAPGTVLGQPGTTRVFRFLHTSTKQQAEEILIAMTTITGMTTRGDLASGRLSVQGTPDQVKLGAWLFAELDKSAPVAADTGVHEYRLAGGTENVVRVFFLDRGQTVDELREFATMLRTIADLPRAFTCNTTKTVALRGTNGDPRLTAAAAEKQRRNSSSSCQAAKVRRLTMAMPSSFVLRADRNAIRSSGGPPLLQRSKGRISSDTGRPPESTHPELR